MSREDARELVEAIRRALRAQDAWDRACDEQDYPDAHTMYWESEEVNASLDAVVRALQSLTTDSTEPPSLQGTGSMSGDAANG
jgi:hypothetical protein